ncbi:hypothetical protein P8452_18940 [Trifolium repens]|nr:hypothetical protein P8452_18940 [Trifolium repens]
MLKTVVQVSVESHILPVIQGKILDQLLSVVLLNLALFLPLKWSRDDKIRNVWFFPVWKPLNDTRKIRRKRKDVTASTFDSWELKCKRLKEDVFDQPLFTGSCKELINIYKREYIHSKPHLVISKENHMDNATSTSPINQVADKPITDAPEIIGNASSVEEIEQICSVVNAPPPTIPTHSIDTEPIIEVEIPYGATSHCAHASEVGTPSTDQDTILHNYDIPDTNQLINSRTREQHTDHSQFTKYWQKY